MAHLKRDTHSKNAQGVHTTTKIERKDTYRPAQSSKTCALPFHLLFPLTTTLSARREHSCRDCRPPWQRQPSYRASCISWHSMSRAMWQLKATFANYQSFKKRESLSPSPYNPMTCSASLHTSVSSSGAPEKLSIPPHHGRSWVTPFLPRAVKLTNEP